MTAAPLPSLEVQRQHLEDVLRLATVELAFGAVEDRLAVLGLGGEAVAEMASRLAKGMPSSDYAAPGLWVSGLLVGLMLAGE